MRLLLYRIALFDEVTAVAQASAIPGVTSVQPRNRGVLVECADNITDWSLTALDTIMRLQATETLPPPGPGRARDVQPGDDRTANVT